MKYLQVLLLVFIFIIAGCSEEEAGEDNRESSTDLGVAIDLRNVDVQADGTELHLTGEVKTSENEIYYRMVQGDDLLQDEEVIYLEGNQEWLPFTVQESLPTEVLGKEEAPIILLYGKTDNGEEVNPNYIPVDIGME